MPVPQRILGDAIDLSPRFYSSKVVAASPAAAAETIIATLTITEDVALGKGVLLFGWGATTQGPSGTGYTMRIRRTDVSGTVIVSSGIIPLAAGVLGAQGVVGIDTGITPAGQVYVLTALHTAAAAASTYSAVALAALVV